MGQEIVYCATCQRQLRGPDFEKRSAFRVEGRPYCAPCAAVFPPAQLQASTPSPPPVPRLKAGSTAAIPVVPASKTRRFEPTPRSIQPWVYLAGAGAVLLGMLLLGVALSGRTVPPPPPAAKAPEPPPPLPPPVKRSPPPVEAPAKTEAALRAAREFSVAQPHDYPGRIARYEQALAEIRGSALESETARELDAVRRKYREVQDADWAPVRQAADAAATQEEFARALETLDAARPRHAVADWAVMIDRKKEEIQARAAAVYAELKTRATEARKQGRSEEVAAAQKRLARWGLKLFEQDLDLELQAAQPVPPPVPPGVLAYRKRWEAAASSARARDFQEALSALQAAAAGLSDPALKAEAAADLESFRQAGALSAEVIQALSRAPRGKALAFGYRDSEGRPRRAEGSVVRADASILELEKDKRSVAVELGEVLAGSCVESLREKRLTPAEARAAAVLSLLEGDSDVARRAPEEMARQIPEKYWTLAKAPDGDEAAREAGARSLFFAARSEYEEFVTLSEAVRKYGALLKEYDSTGIVRRNRGLIAQRSEGGKEFLFLPWDLSASGGFRYSAPKTGACWTLDVDPASPGPKDGWLDVDFSVLPGTPYKGWVYAGACCAERLNFQLQAIEGAMLSVPVKATLSVLPKMHASHAGKKDPLRWGWFPLPVPAFSSAGPKTLRLLSAQPGFSVAYVYLSSLTSAPPRDSVVKEAEKARGESAEDRSPGGLREGLVGYWRFDEPSGRAEDSSGLGHHGILKGGPSRGPGRIGLSLALDGDDDSVECPTVPELSAGGKMSVSLWVKCKAPPAQFDGPFGNPKNSDWYEGYGLYFHSPDEIRFFAGNWERNVASAPIVSNQWNHVAGVFDGSVVRIYVNGTEGKASALQVPVVASPANLLLGRLAGKERDYTMAGWIDEVRVYSRVLSPAEIESLAQGRARR